MENAHLRIKIDKISGLITEIYDRRLDRQILAAPRGNQLQILSDIASDAWNMRFDENQTVKLEQAREIKLEEVGPVRVTIKIVQAFSGEKKIKPTENFPSSFFTQYISLYAGLPYLEIRNKVMWWENHKVLKVAFPLNVFADSARYEIPYGSITRSTGFESAFDKARYEVPAQRWADLSDGQYGVALINESKHGYDIKGNQMRLTLLRAPDNPDPLADRGYHTFAYTLYPHQGDFTDGQVVQKGFEFNEPFLVFRSDTHAGELKKSHSFLQINPPSVIVNVLKKAEDDNDFVIRLYNTSAKSEKVTVQFDRSLSFVKEVNLIEDIIEDNFAEKDHFFFNIHAYEIRSFKIRF